MRTPDLRTLCIYIAVTAALAAVAMVISVTLVYYGGQATMWVTAGILAITSFVVACIAGSL